LVANYSRERSGSKFRISLPARSYIPEFHWLAPESSAPADASGPSAFLIGAAAASPTARVEVPTETVWQRLSKSLLIVTVLLLAVNAILTLFTHNPTPPASVLREFWQPQIQDNGGAIVCFGNATSFWPSESVRQAIENGDQAPLENPGRITVTRDDTVTAGNLRAAVSISDLFSGYGITNQLRWPQEVQSAEVNRSDAIFVGAFNNPWSMSLNENLRFFFKGIQTQSQTVSTIQDRTSPGQKWAITQAYPEQNNADYALITRVIDREGKRVVISLAG